MYTRMPWLSKLLGTTDNGLAAESKERDCEHQLEVNRDNIRCRRCPAEWRKLEGK